MRLASTPILTCEGTRALEAGLFAGDEAKEWPAMQRAGRAIAAAVLRDWAEIGGFPPDGRVLALVGKGHNGGDALIAAQAILESHPAARVEVWLVFGERSLRPLTRRAWRELVQVGQERVERRASRRAGGAASSDPAGGDAPVRCDLCLDGVFGFQFRPPAEPAVATLFETVNAWPIRMRAAVDLPSAGLFQADFTYATGCVKTPLLTDPKAGRIRQLDLGFFHGDEPGADRVLSPTVLAPLAGLRAPRSDKRTYGQVFIVAGSRDFPGAALMSVLAALHSGAGLVTAFVPESLVAEFAARAPEAMWVGCPETPSGGLALEGHHLLKARLGRATALVIGSGLGREPETLALAREIVKSSAIPLVIDADALQPDIVRAGAAPRVLTPHAGEFARIAKESDLRVFARETGATVILKGPVTRICGGGAEPAATDAGAGESGLKPGATPEYVYHSFFGGPVLARGGSGDILAGLTGGLLAQHPDEPLLAAARGVVWHGLAADALARAHGQVAVRTTQLLDFLPVVLRSREVVGVGPA
jgi:ADP-dependent NAD(P)H-hydrate dehydratase / NAD(P)H-hydrate epimerase